MFVLNRYMQQFRRTFATRGALGEQVARTLNEITEQGTFKRERVITTAQGSQVQLNGHTGQVVNFCANNYLGLSNHPKLIEAAKKTLDTHGFGLSSVRFICGTQNIHKELERKIAEFHATEDTILFPSCFDANGGVFEALLTSKDAVFSDELNHASIIDGIRLCKAGTKERFKHLSVVDLETKLQAAVATGAADQVRLIVTDGVFSMDGDIAKLDKLVALTQKYPNTYLMVDECHATGVLGKGGRGTPAMFNAQPDLISSTLGKALGGATGGYVTGNADLIELLRQRARPYLFSNSVAPSVVGASLKVLEMINATPELQDKLAENTKYFRQNLYTAGLSVLGNDLCPIVPVLYGDAETSALVAEELLQRGIYVVSFSYPVVPKGQARIRVQISASHTREQLARAVSAFISVSKEAGVIQLHTSAAFEKHTEAGRRLAQEGKEDE